MADGSAAINNHAGLIWAIADLLRGDYKQSEYGRVQERRQALITAAVTGQIEIPGVAA